MDINSGISSPDLFASSVYATSRRAVEAASDQRDLKTAAQAFESYFLTYLLKVMRETVPKNGLLSNRMGEIFSSFLDQEIGKRAAEVGGIGLSDMILSTLADEDPQNVVPRPR